MEAESYRGPVGEETDRAVVVASRSPHRAAGNACIPAARPNPRNTDTRWKERSRTTGTLALQAAKGREKAFRELLNRYERPVFSLIYRMVRDRGLAEDLSQEAFIRAFNAIGSYNPGYKFSSWMFKIAHNLTIDHLRKRRLDTISIHGSPNAVTADEQARTSLVLESPQERPDDYVENLELGSQIEAAIGNLRPEYRAVTLLRHVEGYSYQEIADILELPLERGRPISPGRPGIEGGAGPPCATPGLTSRMLKRWKRRWRIGLKRPGGPDREAETIVEKTN